MFGFGKRNKSFGGSSKNEVMLAEMREAVEKQKRAAKYDPYVLTGRDLAHLVLDCVEDEPVHAADTALVIVGSMAGFAAAHAAATAYAARMPSKVAQADYSAKTHVDGSRLFSGAMIDAALIGRSDSFWCVVEAKARVVLGGKVPAIDAIKARVDAGLGTPSFGIPQMPGRTRCLEKLSVLVEHLWPEFLGTLTARRPDPEGWCLSWGFAAQEVIEAAGDSISCEDAIRILMECAFPMSRMDPDLAEAARDAA